MGKKQDESPIIKTEEPIKKVAILGYAPSLIEAPFEDKTWELWGINSLYKQVNVPLTRYNRWFEVHSMKFLIDRDIKNNLNHVETLRKMNIPVYMTQHNLEIPSSIPYPLAEVINTLNCGDYFTNSISFMIALAIVEGFKEIGVYGVDMAVDTEYHHQRPSCEYFLGIAIGKGITVRLPQTCDLLKTRAIYGFQEEKLNDWDAKVQAMKRVINQRRNEALAEEMKARDTKNQYIGAEMALDEAKKVWQ